MPADSPATQQPTLAGLRIVGMGLIGGLVGIGAMIAAATTLMEDPMLGEPMSLYLGGGAAVFLVLVLAGDGRPSRSWRRRSGRRSG